MKRIDVALCNELGEGRGHFVPLRGVGHALEQSGYTVAYVTSRPDLAKAVGIAPSDIVHVPWPTHRAPHSDARPSGITFGDALFDLIYVTDERTQEHLISWSTALSAIAPRVVVADYSPSALLVSRDIRPRIAVGNGFTLPPSDIPFYPRLWREGGVPVHEEAAAVRRINAALTELGIGPITYLPEIMSSEYSLLFSAPIVDPYSGLRKGRHLGNFYSEWVDPQTGPRDLTFAYFRDGWARDHRLHAALSSVRNGLFVLPGASEQEIANISRSGSRVITELADMNELLPRTGLMVHYGGGGLVFSAVLSAIPQIVVYTDIEKFLNSEKLAEFGVARLINWHTFEAHELVETIEDCLDDDQMRKAASLLAKENAQYARKDGVDLVVSAILRFL